MTPEITHSLSQPLGVTHALLDVPTPLDHARSLLAPSLLPAIEPIRRGSWGFVTLALRWPTNLQDDASQNNTRLVHQPAEVWAAAVRVRLMTDRLDVRETHIPIHLATPNPTAHLADAQPGHQRVFPLSGTADRELTVPHSALTTDPDTTLPVSHRLRFEPAENSTATAFSTLQRVGFNPEKGGLDWLAPATDQAPAEAWLRWLGPGIWHGERGEPLELLRSGALGGTLWGTDEDSSRLDPQPLVPPIAQIPVQPTRETPKPPSTARVFAAS